PSRLLLENRPPRIVLNALLPSFGMMFTTTPSALVSAEMPLVDITISSTDEAVSWKLLLPELFSMPMPSYDTLVPDLPWNAPPPETTSLPGSTWYWPPTSPRPDRPVVSEASEEMLFVLAGRLSRRSVVTTCWRRTFCTSTTGLTLVTVTVSARPPTRSSPSTLAVKPADSVIPSRTTVVNPGRLKVTL